MSSVPWHYILVIINNIACMHCWFHLCIRCNYAWFYFHLFVMFAGCRKCSYGLQAHQTQWQWWQDRIHSEACAQCAGVSCTPRDIGTRFRVEKTWRNWRGERFPLSCWICVNLVRWPGTSQVGGLCMNWLYNHVYLIILHTSSCIAVHHYFYFLFIYFVWVGEGRGVGGDLG